MKSKTKATTIDEYLAVLSEDKRAALERLRRIIKSAAPKAQECISYQLPSFRQDGMLVGFGARGRSGSSRITRCRSHSLENW